LYRKQTFMKIIIAGGGFAGLRLARKLSNRTGFEITLIDRFNYHQFQPLFYQVATAGLDASNISFPLRKVFHGSRNVKIRIAEILRIEPESRKLVTSIGDLEYDKLVLAMGADTHFFNNPQLQESAFPMKSTVEALQLRHRLLQHFEDALIASPEERKQLLTIVVVGGGPTGVELSGAIAEMKKYVLPRDYPEIDFSEMKIYLMEGSNRTLSGMSATASTKSRAYLEELGVTVLTDTLVAGYDGNLVTLKDGTTLPTKMVIWAAGIKGNVPEGVAADLIARGNRILVDAQNRMKGQEDIFVLGDLACMDSADYPNGHPQVAPVAIQQADLLARNLRTGEWKPFVYKDKGSMATVGRNLAVVDIPKPRLHLGGFIAWLIWMSLHLMLILGVKNRLFVFLNWLYNYITYDQSLRLIFKEFYRTPATPKR
jgi:NADH:ubiquinone reductase (H+-translocating)